MKKVQTEVFKYGKLYTCKGVFNYDKSLKGECLTMIKISKSECLTMIKISKSECLTTV